MARSGEASGRAEAVLTCPGEIDDPNFPQQCSQLLNRLQTLLNDDEIKVVKCEPWNSVKITFDLPAEAAEKLSKLAETGDDVLREMGILSLQIQGGQIISMTIMTDEELRQRKSSTIKSESAQAASSADVKTSAASASSASAASSSSSSVATAMSSNVKLEHSDSNLTSSLLVNLRLWVAVV